MKRLFVIIVTMIMGMWWMRLYSHNMLYYNLIQVIDKVKAQVGVAVIIDGKDTLTVGNDYHYPMMSVLKFHQALAVADYLHTHRLSLDTPVYISHEALRPDTYSPLCDRYPEGNISLSVGELLKYTLQQSDNNACDILFSIICSPTVTDRYIRSLGIDDFTIAATEDDMHRDISLCHSNWTTPLAAAQLLETFLAQDTLNDKSLSFIHRTMTECRTGLNRLPRPLAGTSIVIGHKTGTSDTDGHGRIIAVNDIGFVFLPNGHRYTITVFIANSSETMQDTEKIIGDISEVVYRYVSGSAAIP